jgi:SAM-dependent methyltransferase
MHPVGPDDAELRALLDHGDARDRAFVDAMTRLRWARAGDPSARAVLEALHVGARDAALRAHREIRAAIASGHLRGPALRERFESIAPLERDHWVEEVLGVAYPPLDEPRLAHEQIGHTTSGYDEIVHAFDATGLGPGDRFLDVGSGAGKAVMLAALLTGARAFGVEREATLDALARRAVGELALDAQITLRQADAREATLDEAEVVFLYLPFTGASLATVIEKLARRPRDARRFLCAGALDAARWPELVAVGAPRSWLQVYAWRAAVTSC